MDEKLTAAITRSAKLAAAADSKEGGFRSAGNALNLLSWGIRVRQGHDRCGHLELIVGENSTVEAIICPVHGRFEAPAWVEPT